MLDSTHLDALKALVAEYRGRADDIDAAISLHEVGYQTDQAFIASEIQKAKDEVAQKIKDVVPENGEVDPVALLDLAATLTP